MKKTIKLLVAILMLGPYLAQAHVIPNMICHEVQEIYVPFWAEQFQAIDGDSSKTYRIRGGKLYHSSKSSPEKFYSEITTIKKAHRYQAHYKVLVFGQMKYGFEDGWITHIDSLLGIDVAQIRCSLTPE